MPTFIMSEVEREYLHTTRKRLMELPPERIINVQTPPATLLVQVQSLTSVDRDVVLAFLKAVNELCDGALRKGGRVNLSAVQAAEAGFATLADQHALGTEDTNTFLRMLRDGRAMERNLDVPAIEAAIRARAKARADKDFATADRLQQELVAQGLVLLDHAQGTDWTLHA